MASPFMSGPKCIREAAFRRPPLRSCCLSGFRGYYATSSFPLKSLPLGESWVYSCTTICGTCPDGIMLSSARKAFLRPISLRPVVLSEHD